jgi:hypothetical protein
MQIDLFLRNDLGEAQTVTLRLQLAFFFSDVGCDFQLRYLFSRTAVQNGRLFLLNVAPMVNPRNIVWDLAHAFNMRPTDMHGLSAVSLYLRMNNVLGFDT